jgi:hypothetical protein
LLGARWSAHAIDSRWSGSAARHAWRCWHLLLRQGPGA